MGLFSRKYHCENCGCPIENYPCKYCRHYPHEPGQIICYLLPCRVCGKEVLTHIEHTTTICQECEAEEKAKEAGR